MAVIIIAGPVLFYSFINPYFHSFTTFSFLGSAMLGGFLIDEHGFGTTLYVTAGIQYVSLIPYFFLMRYFKETPKEERK